MANLLLNRLLIFKQGAAVYDEIFHKGVNIIRGENGVGKSTISNAIYYLLGGDFTKWLPEIEKCDFIMGEIELNEKIVTVKREITRVPMQPMSIYYNDYEKASKDSTGWIVYPYKRSSKGLSFSQVLFKALEYPEIETADDEYITFNQALRLMYIDQTSPLDELMKDIEFDSPLIRRTTGDLLFGVYDNALFNLQLLVKNLRKNESEYETELKLLRNVYETIDITSLEKSIKEADEQLIKIDATLKDRESVKVLKADKKSIKLAALQDEVGKLSEELQAKLNEQNLLKLDQVDSQQFIGELNDQILALETSDSIRAMLGELKISYCPSCLKPTRQDIAKDHCELCKEPLDIEKAKAQIFRIRQQLESQIRESQIILQDTEQRQEDLTSEIETVNSQLKIKQRELNKLSADRGSERDQVYDELNVTKGRLIQQTITWQRDLATAKKYWSIHNSYERVVSEIKRNTQLIEEKKSRQKLNYQLVLAEVNRYAKKLLTDDGEYETAFKNAGLIELDFLKNSYSLDSRNNFSASSQVILKNSIRFGIFFASLKLDIMRFPKFILCDNIEDKGMNEVRSRNFQRNLVSIASGDEFKDKRFQIIFTTSMVEKSLDIPAFTIGQYYTPARKALLLPSETRTETKSQENGSTDDTITPTSE